MTGLQGQTKLAGTSVGTLQRYILVKFNSGLHREAKNRFKLSAGNELQYFPKCHWFSTSTCSTVNHKGYHTLGSSRSLTGPIFRQLWIVLLVRILGTFIPKSWSLFVVAAITTASTQPECHIGSRLLHWQARCIGAQLGAPVDGKIKLRHWPRSRVPLPFDLETCPQKMWSHTESYHAAWPVCCFPLSIYETLCPIIMQSCDLNLWLTLKLAVMLLVIRATFV